MELIFLKIFKNSIKIQTAPSLYIRDFGIC